MTVMATAEASRHGRRPTVLYQFLLAAPLPPPDTLEGLVFEDLMKYADLTALGVDWAVSQGAATEIEAGITNPVYGVNSVQFHTTGAGNPRAFIEQAVSGLTPGATAWATFQWYADGHWFEPMALSITSGATTKTKGVNPPASGAAGSGEAVTPLLTVAGGGIVTIKVQVQSGYPTIGHNDIYVIGRIRLFTSAVEPPDLPEDVEFFRTSFRRSITYQGNLYIPCEIDHTEPSEGVDDAPGTIQITMPADDPVTQILLQKIPPARPMVSIFSYHRPPTDEPDPANVWSSLYDITGIEETIHGATLTCSTLIGQGEALVPAGLVNRDTCDFQTYHPLTCGVNPAAHTFSGVVSAIVGLNVTVTGAAAFRSDVDDYWKLGSIRKDLTATMIRDQLGDTVALEEAIDGLQVGDTVTLLAGDDRTKETCALKFFNSARRRSFPNIPMQNPWYGQGLRA